MNLSKLASQGNSSPKSHQDRCRLVAETRRIEAAYARRERGDLYSWFNPGHLFLMQARERRVIGLMRRLGLTSWEGRRLLEVGCGNGLWLGEFIKWGAPPESLTGVDLLADRIAHARIRLAPRVGLARANAAFLPFTDASFDLVLQSMVFTSVLDSLMKEAMAREMLRVLKPGGLILWYDYHVNNPGNPDVKGVKRREIRQLFPGCQVKLEHLTLAPPLARILAPVSYLLCYLLEKLPFLTTHYLGIIRKMA
jgi:SAM-dependent methyltransferase